MNTHLSTTFFFEPVDYRFIIYFLYGILKSIEQLLFIHMPDSFWIRSEQNKL